ncbi:MAG: prepilin-type N-terminal cleavage/methylation domain-containing protein [Tepidimonas sp.]|uniref:prepilin-type N-terminal cleavage/methylation domain-containing protein n=1 Tax=Tepidimonas sp. TaxID=2002775 RepID=UPI00259E7AA5|nr:prepilin-type N-terminal cleavage/methylation domain-containing protein [Tepidimonas sp.]MDM7456563.1 prepilin-type N-terminal cleavage/methylation domain-containing protein [Tepidimonas sp.]
MPTSAAGNEDVSARLVPRPRGLTLLELLVVLAIVSIASIGVAQAWRGDADRRLDRLATELRDQIEVVRVLARAGGTAAKLSWDAQGLHWHGLPDAALSELPRVRPWPLPDVALTLEPPQSALVLGSEPMGPPWRLTLRHGERARTLAFDGWGAVRLE